jgi:hypothetical protein
MLSAYRANGSCLSLPISIVRIPDVPRLAVVSPFRRRSRETASRAFSQSNRGVSADFRATGSSRCCSSCPTWHRTPRHEAWEEGPRRDLDRLEACDADEPLPRESGSRLHQRFPELSSFASSASANSSTASQSRQSPSRPRAIRASSRSARPSVHRTLRELVGVALEEAACRLDPVAEVGPAAEHERVVAGEIVNVVQLLHPDVDAAFDEVDADPRRDLPSSPGAKKIGQHAPAPRPARPRCRTRAGCS